MNIEPIIKMENDGDLYEWPSSMLGKKLAALEETLSCPICYSIFRNPSSISKCGHAFCYECASKHFDKTINLTTSNKCPSCREEANLASLKSEKIIAAVVESFRIVRPYLLDIAKNESFIVNESFYKGSGKPASQLSKSDIENRIPHPHFHGMSKDKIRKVIEKLCEHQNLKLRTDGDRDALERRHRDFVHLHNAQLDSPNPMQFADVIKEINRREEEREKGAKCSKKTATLVEKLRSGKETAAMNRKFKEMAQEVKNRKRSLHNPISGVHKSEVVEKVSDCENVNDVDRQDTYNETPDNRECASHDLTGSCAPWRILMSTKLNRPFFYNTVTRIGQFTIPAELESKWGHLSSADPTYAMTSQLLPPSVSSVHNDPVVNDHNQSSISINHHSLDLEETQVDTQNGLSVKPPHVLPQNGIQYDQKHQTQAQISGEVVSSPHTGPQFKSHVGSVRRTRGRQMMSPTQVSPTQIDTQVESQVLDDSSGCVIEPVTGRPSGSHTGGGRADNGHSHAKHGSLSEEVISPYGDGDTLYYNIEDEENTDGQVSSGNEWGISSSSLRISRSQAPDLIDVTAEGSYENSGFSTQTIEGEGAGGGWCCPRCTFENMSHYGVCEMCGEQKVYFTNAGDTDKSPHHLRPRSSLSKGGATSSTDAFSLMAVARLAHEPSAKSSKNGVKKRKR